MTLTRITRLSRTSIVVTIPSQIVEAFNINCVDGIEMIPLKKGGIIIKNIMKI